MTNEEKIGLRFCLFAETNEESLMVAFFSYLFKCLDLLTCMQPIWIGFYDVPHASRKSRDWRRTYSLSSHQYPSGNSPFKGVPPENGPLAKLRPNIHHRILNEHHESHFPVLTNISRHPGLITTKAGPYASEGMAHLFATLTFLVSSSRFLFRPLVESCVA